MKSSVECWKCTGSGDWLVEGDGKCIACGGNGVMDRERLEYLRDIYWPDRLREGKVSQQKYDWQIRKIEAGLASISGEPLRFTKLMELLDKEFDLSRNELVSVATEIDQLYNN